jgi:hypothetical protein
MTTAIREKSAKGRAALAAAYIRRGITHTRGFSNCFEMGDGDQVEALLIGMAGADTKVKEYATRAGWMTP